MKLNNNNNNNNNNNIALNIFTDNKAKSIHFGALKKTFATKP